jgi:hypothetical protein
MTLGCLRLLSPSSRTRLVFGGREYRQLLLAPLELEERGVAPVAHAMVRAERWGVRLPVLEPSPEPTASPSTGDTLNVTSTGLYMQDYGGPVGFRMALPTPSASRPTGSPRTPRRTRCGRSEMPQTVRDADFRLSHRIVERINDVCRRRYASTVSRTSRALLDGRRLRRQSRSSSRARR